MHGLLPPLHIEQIGKQGPQRVGTRVGDKSGDIRVGIGQWLQQGSYLVEFAKAVHRCKRG